MNFTESLEAINAGHTVTRRKWQGKAKVYLVKNKFNNIDHIEVKTINCIIYAASSEDLLAIDWELANQEIKSKQIPYEEIIL